MGGWRTVRRAVVLFDLDETLIHDRASTAASFAAVAAAHGLDGAALQATMRAAAFPLWRDGPAAAYCEAIGISWWEGLAGPFGPSPVAELAALHAWIPRFRAVAWSAALAALHTAASPVDLEAAFTADRLRRNVPYADAAATLERLRAAGHRLGVVTNGAPDYQRLKLDGSGLRPWFDAVVVSGEVGVGKPDPRILRVALDRLGCVADQAAMVGDNPARDVAGARAAGILAVLVDRGEPGGGADAVVRQLSEIPGLVA